MTWVVVFIGLAVIVLLTLSSQKRVAWANKLQRLNPGVRHKAEWMAPDYVVRQVRNDYLVALRWLRECAFHDWEAQWNAAPAYLAGRHLQRHQQALNAIRVKGAPRYRDVLHADHSVEVRHFTDDGERCLVIDRQTCRTILTFDYHSLKPCIAQALDDGTVIYRMNYDKRARRWKIEQFVQELPGGWGEGFSRRVRVYSTLPPTNGRDH